MEINHKIHNHDKTFQYKFYDAEYKFIPLFNIYLGMGYSFCIGWDNIFNSMIGIIENGSDYHGVQNNAIRALRYFSARLTYLELNLKELQKLKALKRQKHIKS